jgi:hypothetical protein
MARVSLLKRIRAATDTYYNHVYYSGSIAVQAFREGRDNGLRGDALVKFQNGKIANPPADYNAKAGAEARRLTTERKQRWRFLGWLAAFVWLASGVYFFGNSKAASFFSISSLGFFVIGTIVAKLVLGSIFHILWGIGKFLRLAVIAVVETIVGKMMAAEPSQRAIRLGQLLIAGLFNLVICVAEIIATFALALWVFDLTNI